MGETVTKSSVLYRSIESYKFTTLASMFLHIRSDRYNLELSLINGDRFPRPIKNTLYIEIPENFSFRVDDIGVDFRFNSDGDTVFNSKIDETMILSDDTNIYYIDSQDRIRKSTLSEKYDQPEQIFRDISEFIDQDSKSFQIVSGTDFKIRDASLITGELDSPVKINKSKLSMAKIE